MQKNVDLTIAHNPTNLSWYTFTFTKAFMTEMHVPTRTKCLSSEIHLRFMSTCSFFFTTASRDFKGKMEHRRRIGASDLQARRCSAWQRSSKQANLDIQKNAQDSTPSHFILRFDDNGEERKRRIWISRPQMPASECRTTQTRNKATENTENRARLTCP